VLAAALFINYICCGAAAGSSKRFGGLRQAPYVGRNYMTISKIIVSLTFLTTLLGCNQSQKGTSQKEEPFVLTYRVDSSGQRLYDFLKIVIKKKQLDTTYGLVIFPMLNLHEPVEDSVFIKTLLLHDGENLTPIKKPNRQDTFTIGGIDRCLTEEDIGFMLKQKEDNRTFRWNTTRLNFTDMNKFKEQYRFSIPLFSKDGKKVLVGYENVMGTGRVILFRYENNQWFTQTGSEWIY
jgi:hypothetical protein